MMSQTVQQIITIHILHNISNKSNQSIKFSQLITYIVKKNLSSEFMQTVRQGA